MNVVVLAILLEEREKLEDEIRQEGKGAWSITQPKLEKLGRLNTKIKDIYRVLKLDPPDSRNL